jgi:hypothetical protein
MPDKLAKQLGKMEGFNQAVGKGGRYLGVGC